MSGDHIENIDCKKFVDYLYKDSICRWKQNFMLQSLFSKLQDISTNFQSFTSQTKDSTSMLRNGQLVSILRKDTNNKENEDPQIDNNSSKDNKPLDKRKLDHKKQIYSSHFPFYCQECNKGFETAQGFYSHMSNTKKHAKTREKYENSEQKRRVTKKTRLTFPLVIDYEKEVGYYFEFARQTVGTFGNLEHSVIVNLNE